MQDLKGQIFIEIPATTITQTIYRQQQLEGHLLSMRATTKIVQRIVVVKILRRIQVLRMRIPRRTVPLPMIIILFLEPYLIFPPAPITPVI